MNVNPYYTNPQGELSDKDYYLTIWGYMVGTDQAEFAWKQKQDAMRKNGDACMVMGDIAPYKSMIDGSMIESRSKHRAHLKQHGCIEVGNETKHLKSKPMTPPPGLKEKLIEVANQKLRYK